MGMIALVHADFLKQRHTSYWGIHNPVYILLPALSECR